MKSLDRKPCTRLRLLASLLLILPAFGFAGPGGEPKDELAGEAGGQALSEAIFEADLALPPGQTVWIDANVGGSLQVEGWDQERISMRAEKSGRDRELCSVALEKRAGGAFVLAEVPPAVKKQSINCSVDITLRVPYESDLEIELMGGSIEIANLEGRMSGRTMGGSISLEDLKGRVDLTTMGGGISVARSSLDGTVKTMGGDVILDDVAGDLNASTMGGKVKRLASSSSSGGERPSGDQVVTVSTMGGRIEIEEAPAGVKANTMGGSIHVVSARGFAAVETMGGDIEIDAIDGWVTASTMGGDVTVVMVGDPKVGERDVSISSKGGDIELTVPRGLAMDIDITLAYTKDSRKRYEIKSDFDLELEETTDWDRSRGTPVKYKYGTGIVGAGTFRIVLDTINGNVLLREGK